MLSIYSYYKITPFSRIIRSRNHQKIARFLQISLFQLFRHGTLLLFLALFFKILGCDAKLLEK